MIKEVLKTIICFSMASTGMIGCSNSSPTAIDNATSDNKMALVAYDHGIYNWNGSGWSKANGGAISVAVDTTGIPWVINKNNQIFKKADASLTSSWGTALSGLATDIGISADGSVWITGTDSIPGTNDHGIYKWNGSGWSKANGGAIRIAVSPSGVPWVINSTGQIFKKADASLTSSWGTALSGLATDIGIGADGSVWITGTDSISGTNDHGIYKWNGSGWSKANGGAIRISVSPSGVPWVINSTGHIFKKADASLTSSWGTALSGLATDIGIGANGSVWITGTDNI